MKKLVTFCCLVATFVLSNLCIAWAGNLICTPGTIELGTDYVNTKFSKTISIYNSGVSNTTVTIEVGFSELGLQVSSTKFRLYGKQTKEITVKGHFPNYNGTFGGTLTVKDGMNNQQVIFINGYAKKKSNSGNTKLPAPKNIKLEYTFISPRGYMIRWDTVANAKSYKVGLPDGTYVTTNRTYFAAFNKWPEWINKAYWNKSKVRITVVAIDKNGKYGHKANVCVPLSEPIIAK